LEGDAMPGSLGATSTAFGEFDAEASITSLSPGYRGSGVLLRISALPSPYGIGDLGGSAYTWIDLLKEARQGWWQIGSPYQSISSFATDGLFVSPQFLIDDGLLKTDDCADSFPPTVIDCDAVTRLKQHLLDLAWMRFKAGERRDLIPEYEHFCESRADWLEDYALFRALKLRYANAHYLAWPKELVERTPIALAKAKRELADVIDKFRLEQFLIHRQARLLKVYAHAKGVRLIGDLPFFVAQDSSDVWANPEYFLSNKEGHPRLAGGAPPHIVNSKGQLRSYPVYDWDVLRSTGYGWCIARIRAALAHVDVIRLDHFRGYAGAWRVAAGATGSQSGEWGQGPGGDFFRSVERELGKLPFIAEDVGMFTPFVSALCDQFHIPRTRFLQLGFDGRADNIHLPHNYSANTVAYTGTIDKGSTREWFEGLTRRERRWILTYLAKTQGETRGAVLQLIRLVWSSEASLAIAPLDDLINRTREGQMIGLGSAAGSRRWRLTEHMLHAKSLEWLGDLTLMSDRVGKLPHRIPQGERVRAAVSR
jgi:4-alpha-glucanotransferase